MNEVDEPQYSEMVLSSLDFSFYTGLKAETDYLTRPELRERLQQSGIALKSFLLQLRESNFCIDTALGTNRFLFNNILENLQHRYSNGVDQFLATLHRLRGEYPQYWGIHLPNPRNPFFSTSNTAYHALKYAYGMKSYYEHRLTPRYCRNGVIEYSHVGKFYLSLHEADALLLDERPHNVPQLDREGRVWLPPPNAGNIGPEKEFAFMAYMDADRVFFQRVAKFPDLSGEYLPIYEVKYGFNQELFDCFKFLIEDSSLNSPFRHSVLDLLSEWLCAYQATLLIYLGFMKAQENGGTLIYLGQDGLLTEEANKPLLTHGEGNRPTREDVHIHRSCRRVLADSLGLAPPPIPITHGFALVDEARLRAAVDQLNIDQVINETRRRTRGNFIPTQDLVVGQRQTLITRLFPLQFPNIEGAELDVDEIIVAGAAAGAHI